jgi:hypothetical protein
MRFGASGTVVPRIFNRRAANGKGQSVVTYQNRPEKIVPPFGRRDWHHSVAPLFSISHPAHGSPTSNPRPKGVQPRGGSKLEFKSSRASTDHRAIYLHSRTPTLSLKGPHPSTPLAFFRPLPSPQCRFSGIRPSRSLLLAGCCPRRLLILFCLPLLRFCLLLALGLLLGAHCSPSSSMTRVNSERPGRGTRADLGSSQVPAQQEGNCGSSIQDPSYGRLSRFLEPDF